MDADGSCKRSDDATYIWNAFSDDVSMPIL